MDIGQGEVCESIQIESLAFAKFQIVSFKTSRAGIHHMLLDRDTQLPLPAASIYEAHLVNKTDSHNSRYQELNNLSQLYAFGLNNKLDIERLLLCGQGLTTPQIRAFAAWIKTGRTPSNGIIPMSKRRSINAIFTACSIICCWFIRQFAKPLEEKRKQVINVELLVQAQKAAWKEVRIKVRKDPEAPDLTEQEIATIEQFLRPENRSRVVGEARATRDYLFWRMAIEFGMRKGEILAMRLSDCPARNTPYFRIIRIEERGLSYNDPRSNPPRPKTLSRDLGFIIPNTVFPGLVSAYVSSHRYKWVKRNCKKIKNFILPHKFLIVADNGAPLSLRAADDIARAIKIGTGIDFNWHLARHAFFNRAYAGVASVADRTQQQIKLTDLQHWGGWESEKSLEMYTRRVRADRARHALTTWQQGGGAWTALA